MDSSERAEEELVAHVLGSKVTVKVSSERAERMIGLMTDGVEAAAKLETDAHAAILVWCRRVASVCDRKPVMRERKGRCEVLDASYFDRHVIADGYCWADTLDQLRMNGWNI